MQLLITFLVSIFLPIVGGFSTSTDTAPALYVARVPDTRAAAGCVSAMDPVTAQGQVCLLPGDYISLVAPASLAVGGKQGAGADAAWQGNPGEFALIAPERVIADADIVEIGDLAGYVEFAGPFTAPDSRYTLIALQPSAGAVEAAQVRPSFEDMIDFRQLMAEMMDEGEVFSVNWPGDMTFWEIGGLVSFRPSQCGVSRAVWIAERRVRILNDRIPLWVIVPGHFDPPGLDQCMGAFRWVHVGDLMTSPYAKSIQDRVNQRRGGNVTPFAWFTDAKGQAYAFWSVASGTLAYYGYKLLNAPAPSPATFLYIPEQFLDVTCTVTNGVKACLVTEGQPDR